MLTETFVTTRLGRLRLQTAGSGEPILFWPSLLMDGSLWAAQAAHFAPHYRVVLIDSPGHGGSEALSASFSLDDCAACAVQILDALGLARAHLVGNSWGGMMGATFGARYPERAGALVLMNATASAAGWRQKVEFGALRAIARAIGGLRGPLAGSAVRAFLGSTSEARNPAAVAAVRKAVARVDIRSVHWAVHSVVALRPDQRALLGRIQSPVLVVAGEEDRTFPVPETRLMADAIPGARFEVLARTGHLAALENPVAVNALIEAFLRAHPLPTA